MRGWKKTYCAELASRKRKGDDKPVEKLPVQALGRPLALGQAVERHAMKVIHQVRESGGVVNNSVVIGIIKGIMRDTDSNLLAENGGPITVGKEAARRLLGRMQFVKRRGTTKAKVVPSDFQALEAQFLGDIRSIVIFENIPAKLILNWDHTGLNYVPSSSWTLEEKGAQKVPIVAIEDKRQLTAVFACSLAGDFLPPQIIYAGKTPACLPKAPFPSDWHITYTHNHWANEATMMDYVRSIFFPYLTAARKELKLSSDFPALAIFDHFKGQMTESFLDFMEANNVIVVEVPPRQAAAFGFERKQACQRLSQKEIPVMVCRQHCTAAERQQSYQACGPLVKPLSAKWIIEAVADIGQRKEVIINGFHHAGIFDALKDVL